MQIHIDKKLPYVMLLDDGSLGCKNGRLLRLGWLEVVPIEVLIKGV
jgi:hypothetical protein